MIASSPNWLSRIRHALVAPHSRAALFGLVLAVFSAQLLLQVHLVKHELLPGVHQVCEQCVSAKGSAPPPAVVVVAATSPQALAPVVLEFRAPLSRAPLIERSRGPPARLS